MSFMRLDDVLVKPKCKETQLNQEIIDVSFSWMKNCFTEPKAGNDEFDGHSDGGKTKSWAEPEKGIPILI